MRHFTWILFIVMFACAKNVKETASTVADTVAVEHRITSNTGADKFSGEYMIGDGVWTVTPNQDQYEMRTSPSQKPDILFFENTEHDTIHVYATKDHRIIIRMFPGNERGMYYEKDEKWEVHRVQSSPVAHEETEAEETERIFRERAAEDSLAFLTLNAYDGKYTLYTESEGAEGTLELKYNRDKMFKFKLKLEALDICRGIVEGEIFMDRTQHGFYKTDHCMLHFNFNGNWGDSGMVVEIDQPDPCDLMKGECNFTGKYTQGTPKP